MKITIIGSGNVGSALAAGWKKSNHEVVMGVRNPDSPKAIKVRELIPGIELNTIPLSVRDAEVVVITTPPEAIHDIISEWGAVDNKIIIDATNSIRTRPEGFPTVYHAVSALCEKALPVKCFNTTGFENMLNPVYHGAGIDMFMAGDHDRAKEVARQLALDLGFENCYDFGGSDRMELLEKFAFSWINLAIMQGVGRNMAFKLVKR